MLQPGDRIGRYEVQRRLGRGGMGTVYVAHDPVLGRLVAVKMFAGDLDAGDAAEKFAREARAAAALNHTNIVTIHDFGEYESQPFIVMEYIQGDTLARMIRKQADLSLSERLRLVEDLCAGAAYAHGFEVIHRDIKPANLMVDRANRLKILDFGIARILGTSLSKGTALIGTPGYMAPEQIRGGTIDRRSDLFSIGVVAYELLSYVEAFPGDSVPAITHRILTEEPLPLPQLVEDIPDELVAIVERALKKEPAERYADAAALGAAIAQVRAKVDGDPRFATLRPTLQGSQSRSDPASAGRPSNLTPDRISSNALVTPASGSGRQAQLARKRTEQLERALIKARVELNEGRLIDARESCLEALSLNEAHAGALQLEKEIDAALARQRARELVAEGRQALEQGALTRAEGVLRNARELDSTSIDVRQLERDLRIKRAEQADAEAVAELVRLALHRGRAALAQRDPESALTAARQAKRLDPSSSDAHALEAEALRRMDVETGVEATTAVASPATDVPTVVAPTVVAPGPVPKPAPKPPAAKTGPPQAAAASAALAHLRTSAEAATSRAVRAVVAFATETVPRALQAAVQSTSQVVAPRGANTAGRNRTVAVWAAASVIAFAVIGAVAFAYFRPAQPAPVHTGSVTIDARPWATVTSIVGADERRVPLPDDASTPLTIALPVGVYRVTLAGPQPDAAPVERTVTVVEGQTLSVGDVRFPAMNAESYFESYVVSHQELPASESPGDASAQQLSNKAPEESR